MAPLLVGTQTYAKTIEHTYLGHTITRNHVGTCTLCIFKYQAKRLCVVGIKKPHIYHFVRQFALPLTLSQSYMHHIVELVFGNFFVDSKLVLLVSLTLRTSLGVGLHQHQLQVCAPSRLQQQSIHFLLSCCHTSKFVLAVDREISGSLGVSQSEVP